MNITLFFLMIVLPTLGLIAFICFAYSKEFRAFLDKNVMSLYESEDFKVYWKLKSDIAGLLFAAIHGSTDVGE